jgi:hypothetical protein
MQLTLLATTGAAAAAAAVAVAGGAAGRKASPPTYANPAEPDDACAATGDVDRYLVGAGACTDAGGLTSAYYTCDAPTCNVTAPFTLATCLAVCTADDGCTGFDFLTDPTTAATSCHVFVANPPAPPAAGSVWALVAGTQPASGRVVVTSNAAAAGSCCYKHAYPRPNPWTNPVPSPPVQTATQQAVYAKAAAEAAAASAFFQPALEAVIAYCSANATSGGTPISIFGPEMCPGMADLTANGTLAPYPTPAQILQRFSAEMAAAENGHGYGAWRVKQRSRRWWL